MQENVVIDLFREIEEDLSKLYPWETQKISNYIERAMLLSVDFFGEKNAHSICLIKAKKYPSEMAKKIILAEIRAIIKELDGKESQNPIVEQPTQDDPIEGPIDVPALVEAKDISPKIYEENNNHQIKKVFIVHGHDGEMKQEVANVLLKLKLEPIILHEQPDEGKTIIEKFEIHSDVDFAIILLSPDDFAYPKDASSREGRYRARQNVIMELGYFIAKLGRNRVVTLYRQNDNFEIPSDYLGVLYKPYVGEWKYKLVDEMKKIDPKIDKNLL